MQKLKALFASAKRETVIATGSMVALVGSPAFAVEGDIDTTKVLLYIAGGIVAAGAITGAMLGLVALIGVGKKAQRAGT